MKNKEAKTIYKTYKMVYGKEPNFSKENLMSLTIEVQAMAYILHEYGVSIGGNDFRYEYRDLDMPMSMDIQDVIMSQLIGNSEDLNDDSLQFPDYAERTINIAGNAIRSIMSNSENPVETLRLTSNILYVKKYVRPNASDIEIMESTKCSEKDLRDVEQLNEFIEQEKDKDDFNKSSEIPQESGKKLARGIIS